MTDILLGIIIWFLFVDWYKKSKLKYKVNYWKRKWKEPKNDVSMDKYRTFKQMQ